MFLHTWKNKIGREGDEKRGVGAVHKKGVLKESGSSNWQEEKLNGKPLKAAATNLCVLLIFGEAATKQDKGLHLPRF